jgi:cytochrome c peroxidase
MVRHQHIVCLFGLLMLFSCVREENEEVFIPFSSEKPVLQYPEDNLPDSLRILFGRHLFYEPAFAIDSSISCASCHLQQFSFADTARFSLGAEGKRGFRNSPSLLNIAYAPWLMREGGVPTLEMQVLVPIQEREEFNHNILAIVDRLAQNSIYQSLSEKAFGRPVDAYTVTRALAAFQRNLISFNSRFDDYLKHPLGFRQDDKEQIGMRLFYSDSLACGKCHTGILMTDFSFRNNGLYKEYLDKGRLRVTGLAGDEGKFKVPSLRNVAITSPYMHDGSFRSLEEVIDHYAKGGSGHLLQDSLVKGFQLSSFEKSALLSFLQSLTDQSVRYNSEWSRP